MRLAPVALALCLSLALAAPAGAAGSAKRELVDGRVSIRLPSGWNVLDSDTLRARLGGDALPQRAYGTDDGDRIVAVDFPRRGFMAQEIDTLCAEVGGKIEAAGFTFLGAARQKLGGQPFCVIDFQRVVGGALLRVTRAVSSFEGRYLAVTFTARVADPQAWDAQRKQLMRSLKLTHSKGGGKCEAGAAQKCIDAHRHAVCKDGKWKPTSCEQACQPHASAGCRYNETAAAGQCACMRRR